MSDLAANASETLLMRFVSSLLGGDDTIALRLVANNAELAKCRFASGANRESASPYFLEPITHYIYAGDTALHIAAAAYRPAVVRALIASGADVQARNRRGAEPLHYAADGAPGSPGWNPSAQASVIACLIAAGADPNAADEGGAAPLHRAVRTRCAAAVEALLEAGADPMRENKNGSTPVVLATRNTGRGGSGSREAHEQQNRIVEMLDHRLGRRAVAG